MTDTQTQSQDAGTSQTATGTQQATTETWLNDLPEDLRGEPTFTTLKGTTWKEVGPSIAKSLVDTKKFVGADKMLSPQKNWTEAQWNDFYAKAGRPESSDKYDMPELKMEEGVKFSDEKLAAAKNHFHKLGLNASQFKGVVEFYANMANGEVKSGRDATMAATAEAENTLRKEWGTKYDFHAGLARAALAKFGDESLLGFLEESKLGNNPAMVKAFAKIGAGMLEDTASVGGGSRFGTPQMTAQRKIESLKNDKEFQARRQSGDRAAQSEWMEAHRIAALT